MKIKVFCMFVLASIIVASFPLISFAETRYVSTPIPKPQSDNNHFYFANSTYFYSLIINSSDNAALYLADSNVTTNLDLSGSIINSYTPIIDISVHNANIQTYDLKFKLAVYQGTYITYTFNRFLLSDGSYAGSQVGSFSSVGVYDISSLVIYPYIYNDGFVATTDSFKNMNLLSLTFADDHTYDTDFAVIERGISNMETCLNNILEQDSTYFADWSFFIEDFFYTDWEDTDTENWSYFMYKFNNYTYNSNVFYQRFNEWVRDEYRPDHQEHMDKLDDIIDLITGGPESQTYPSEPGSELGSAVDEHNSLESQYVQDQSSQLDSVNNNLFNNIFSSSDIVNGLGFLKVELQEFVFNKPNFAILAIYAVSMGLVVLVIGRKLRS